MRDASRALTADLHSHVSSVEGNGPKSTAVPYPDAFLMLSGRSRDRRGIVSRLGSVAGELPSLKLDEQEKLLAKFHFRFVLRESPKTSVHPSGSRSRELNPRSRDKGERS